MKLLFLLMASFCCAAQGSSTVPLTDLTPQRQMELQHLLKHDCGSCHGLRLKGGLGPSLEKDALTKFTDAQLFLTIKEGRPVLAMPPWKKILTDSEIDYLVQVLRK